MPTWVELAQRAEGAGCERAFLARVVGPRMAGTLPTCYGAGREGALIEKWVHWCCLLRHHVGWSASWVIKRRGHRGSRGHRQKNLCGGRLGRLVEENRDKKPWWMNSLEAVWVTGNGRTLTRDKLDDRCNSVAQYTSLTATSTVTVESKERLHRRGERRA